MPSLIDKICGETTQTGIAQPRILLTADQLFNGNAEIIHSLRNGFGYTQFSMALLNVRPIRNSIDR